MIVSVKDAADAADDAPTLHTRVPRIHFARKKWIIDGGPNCLMTNDDPGV